MKKKYITVAGNLNRKFCLHIISILKTIKVQPNIVQRNKKFYLKIYILDYERGGESRTF